MIRVFLAFFISLSVNSQEVQLKIDIAGTPIASSVEESQRDINLRIQPVYEYFAKLDIGEFYYHGREFTKPVLGRIMAQKDIEGVNSAILSDKVKVFANPGTHFDGILGLCKQNGDYDFAMVDLIMMAYEGRNLLSDKAYSKLVYELLPLTGFKPTYRRRMGRCIKVRETENHILMTEISRYLTNQLRREADPDNPEFDNEKNGFNKWMLKHLQKFVIEGFEEYNSRPYQAYTIAPLTLLSSYSTDLRVKEAASILLDYLSMTFAISSNRLRRQAPIGRQKGHSRNSHLMRGDHMAARMFVLAGNSDIYHQVLDSKIFYGGYSALVAAIGKYRVPEAILEMIISPNHHYFQKFSHYAVELYTKHPKYLFTSGGRFRNFFDMGSGKADGWAFPTSIIPTGGNEIQRQQLFRIKGHNKEKKRNNTCFYKNFACGLNLVYPKDLPAGCYEKVEGFTIVNYQAASCPREYHQYGYYVLIKTKRTPRLHRRGSKNYGFMEVIPQEKMSYEQVVRHAQKVNHKLRFKRISSYITTDGDEIEFFVRGKRLKRYPIKRINGRKVERNFKKWKFSDGDIMNSPNKGVLDFINPKTNQQIILDYSDALRPVRLFRSL